MNLRGPRTTEDPDITLTPLIDVMFLLVIFFMVSTTFSRQAELAVELPEASAQPSPGEGGETLEVVVDPDGRYFVGGQRIEEADRDALVAALRSSVTDGKYPSLVISADARTHHQAVVTAMDAAQEVGFRRLAIATVHSP